MSQTCAHAIETVLHEDKLNPADVAHIKRWLDDPRTEEVWRKIASAANAHIGWLTPTYLVRNVLSLRGLAQHPAALPNYPEHATAAEELAALLAGSAGLPPAAPEILKRFPLLPASLRETAIFLREQAKRQKASGLVRGSRKAKTQARSLFMYWITHLLTEVCGRSLDNEAAVLTDIAFPDAETTADQVRAARRPTSGSSRRKKQPM
jgi:hypothetical protein